MTLASLLWVALGSAFGGVARHWLSGLVGRRLGEGFPWGTFAVNVSGAFGIGLCAASLAVDHLDGDYGNAWLLGVIGFLGSYTTVSSFSLQTLALVRNGERGRAVGNVALSLACCLTAAAIGFAVIDASRSAG
ncbi:MAG: fluoride efflux transporter CrcB [Rhodospirillales bacterium]|nr:MAG: fluoride efflux transporter CrcB [Rhodospirillales bacterium]